jgi:serine/threonine protein kinase
LLQNRYRAIKLLNEGGFGKIYEIEDRGKIKVLKVLFNRQKKAIELFKQEAEILELLRGISGFPQVELQPYFTFQPKGSRQQLHCLVMEKIEGHNLEHWLKIHGNSGITEDLALNWLNQIVIILAVLHFLQYFHRDIKPSNIMIEPNGELVLIDLGAARKVTNTYIVDMLENRSGTRIYSPDYCPPEQYQGKAVPQSDYFALGRTFVYLLTGEKLENLPKEPITEQLIWRDKAPQISPKLADLIDDLIAELPSDRPSTPEAILQRLADIDSSHSSGKSLLIVQNYVGKISTILGKKRRFNYLKMSSGFVALILFGFLGVQLTIPWIAKYYNDRGVVNQRAGKPASAESDFNLAISIYSGYPEAHYNLGRLYEEEFKNFDGARTNYEIAAKAGFVGGYNHLGRLSIIEKDCDAAIAPLEQGLKLAKDSLDKYALFKNLGWAKFCQRHNEEANKYLQKAIELDKSRGAARCLMAQVLEAKNNQIEALKEWKQCQKYASDLNTSEESEWKKMANQRLKLAGGKK